MDRSIFAFFQTDPGTDIPTGTLRSRELRGKEVDLCWASCSKTSWTERARTSPENLLTPMKTPPS